METTSKPPAPPAGEPAPGGEADDLPPCPICQEAPTVDHDSLQVRCDDCGIEVQGGCAEEADATWYAMTQANTLEELRASLAAAEQNVKALEEQLGEVSANWHDALTDKRAAEQARDEAVALVREMDKDSWNDWDHRYGECMFCGHMIDDQKYEHFEGCVSARAHDLLAGVAR